MTSLRVLIALLALIVAPLHASVAAHLIDCTVDDDHLSIEIFKGAETEIAML